MCACLWKAGCFKALYVTAIYEHTVFTLVLPLIRTPESCQRTTVVKRREELVIGVNREKNWTSTAFGSSAQIQVESEGKYPRKRGEIS